LPTDGIGQTTNTTSPTPATTATAPNRETQLGKDAFLQLLVTQLRHQDPTQPKADGEFIAQLAQFSSLEQLTQIQKTLDAMSKAMGVTVPAPTAPAPTTPAPVTTTPA
jgi:flagellar basal-body rod modification protein FlgD